MLVNQNEIRNFQGISAVELNGQTVAVVNLGAQYEDTRGALNYTQAIQNMNLYKANKEAVDADIETFRKSVEEAIG